MWPLTFENGNLCFEDAAAAADRTLRRLGQFSLVEGKPAGAALRRLNDHAVPGGADRADQMLEIRLDLAALQSKLTRDARNGPRGGGKHIDQLAAKCHSSLCGRDGRETTQPNRIDAVYWATGLTEMYLPRALTGAPDVSRSRHAAQHLQTHSIVATGTRRRR